MSAVKSNFKQFSKAFLDTKKQVRFATSKAINDTLKEARSATIKQAQHAQKGNKKWWFNKKYGILRTFANKKKLIGSVYTRMPWASLQEEGGIKRPKGRAIAVPTENMAKSNRKAGGMRKLLNQKSVFINKNKNAVYRRVGGKKSRKVKRLATLTKQAVIDRPILRFRATAHKVATRRFLKNLQKATDYALRTRK